jgi:hypothetical protein
VTGTPAIGDGVLILQDFKSVWAMLFDDLVCGRPASLMPGELILYQNRLSINRIVVDG